MPKVSVIIPVYNVEKYLKQCLESVINQTLTDIEIICVDDGSTDTSGEISDNYAAKDNRIKVIHKPNAGYGHSVNKGIEHAKGEYIGIIDSDDYVSSDMYEALYNEAKKTKVDIVRSDFYEIRTVNGVTARKEIPGFEDLSLYNRVLSPVKDKGVFFYKTMNIWTGIYRTEFIRSKGIRLNETPGASFQDCGFWFQTMTLAQSVFFSDKRFYHYRRDNPGSSVNDKNKVYNIFEEYSFIRKFLNNHPRVYEYFFKTYAAQKYYAYNDCYLRIRNRDKINFLRRAADEFCDDLNELGEEAKDIDPNALRQMLRIIDSPEIYLYESAVDFLQKEYNQVRKKYISLCKNKNRCRVL